MARTKEFEETLVLKKAVQLFWHKGFHGTSAQDLVEGLGISRSSLYDTFGDKRNLFIQSLQHYRKKLLADALAVIDASEDMAQTIQQIFKLVTADTVESNFSKGCFMVNSAVELALHDKEIAAIVNQNMHDFEELLCRLVKKGQADGSFTTSQTPRSLARFLFNCLSGIRVRSKSNTDKKVYEDIVSVTLSVLKR